MKDIALNTVIRQCQKNELPQEAQALIDSAVAATNNSYAPYSNFYVGAALRLANGDIITGANQENASSPVGMCAERSALFNAQSNQPDQPVVALAIAARNENGLTAEPVSPCGICRQALLETEQRYHCDIRVYMYGTHCVYVADSIKDLLPLSFTDSSMR